MVETEADGLVVKKESEVVEAAAAVADLVRLVPIMVQQLVLLYSRGMNMRDG